MDPRERWQALHTQLRLAQARLDAGDRPAALAAANAALELDPNFLAAHSLRDRILSAPPPAPAQPPAPRAISADGYAQFEQRARRRRVDRRLDAARTALAAGRVKDAAAAIDEVVELDPNLPELQDITAELEALRIAAASTHRGRWIAAAAAFAIVVLGASWLQDAGALGSRSIVAVAPLVVPPPGLSVTVTAAEPAADSREPSREAVATSGDARPSVPVDSPSIAVASVNAEPVSPPSIPVVATVGSPLNAPPVPPAVSEPVPNVAPAASATPAPSAPPTRLVPPPPDDETLVKQTLQRYRLAYEELDARLAQSVWPAVNQDALARAFDGLESQSLTFDACNVTVQGDAAAATCRGSARYVPKVGSREPRVESRTWNFTLRKDRTAWTIESARAER